jgi:tetratricopeptide (TPR) repeat protein
MTTDAELLGGLADVFELTLLKENRRFIELASRASAILAQFGDPSDKDETYATLIGSVASFGALATYETARYAETLAFAETQIRAGRAIPNASVTLARGLNWRALAKEALGRLAAAAEDYQEGLVVTERLDPPDARVRDELRLNYMDLRVKRGEQGAANVQGISPAKSLATAGAASDAELAEINRMGQAAISSGQFELGITLLTTVMNQALRVGHNRVAGIAASNLGQALVDIQGPDAGLPYLEKACSLLSQPGMGEQLAIAAYNRGLAERQMGKDDEATASFRQAWAALRTEAPRSLTSLPVLHALAMQRIVQRDYRRARAALARGLQIYESLRPEVGMHEREHEGALRSYRALLELQLYLSLNDNWTDEIVTLVERGKARFWAESIAALDTGGLTKELATSRPESGTVSYRLPPTARGGLILSYFVGPNATFIVSGKVANPRVRRIDIGEAQLSELVEAMTFDLLGSSSRAGRAQASAVELSRLLLDEFDPAGARALFVLPDGPLWALPFDALPVVGTSGVLGDRVPSVIAPTISLLTQLQERAGDPPDPTHWRMLAVGTPAAGPEFVPIPGTAEQVSAIAQLMPGTTTLTGPSANRLQLTRHVTSATHVHIAAHAFGTPDDDMPHIVLSNGTDGPDRLYVADITRLRMRAELVFLSACGTSVGRLSAGEGMVSVGRAFVLAGARCVIATLWPIEDAEAAELVSSFYARLRKGVPPARAALEARRHAIRQGADPRTWAGLQVIGDGLAGENTFVGT